MIRRILIIKWSAMGDITIASALFEDIRNAFPGRELHLNILPPWDKLFAADPRFAQIFAFDLRDRRHPLRAARRWLHHVGQMQYDLVIDLQANDRSRLLLSLLWLTGRQIPYRIGNNRQFPYNIRPQKLPSPVHAFTRMRAALQAGGIPTATSRPVLHIPERNRERARSLLAQHQASPGRYGVLLPGCQAAGHLKRWGADHYSALARQLHAGGLDRLVVIGARDEWEDCLKIQQACGPWLVNLCSQTEILDIIPLCEGARLIVANDTGTAHLAAAAGKPMLVICGPTDPRRVKPLGDHVAALQGALPCINCYLKECTHHTCMTMITPPLVAARLSQIAPCR